MSVRDGVGKIPERSLTTIDGEEYDRNLIAHTLDGLNDLIPLDYAKTEWLPRAVQDTADIRRKYNISAEAIR